ncbi:MAG: hypothetical protein M1818_003190 [Claussenomyces sp. TS43310]|nr:MAG: hypothetical protein M1818_003190 [Claussenomyces sp. TS43310]
MNGSANGHPAAVLGPVESSDANPLLRIHEALELIHSPYSSNGSRKEASVFLEGIKDDKAAPYQGFVLAYDRTQQFVVRHFALSLLEHAIKHKWTEYSNTEAETLRGWVLQLSQNISLEDPLYIRNKTAQLWVEIAKRSWGTEWSDMDELLVKLWEMPGSLVHKEFVLFVLETLSEDVFNGEDTAAALREGVLNRACVEIFTPATVLAEAFPERQLLTGVRCGDDGWLMRIGVLLGDLLIDNAFSNEQNRLCAVKCLAVFKSTLPWITPMAVSEASCVKRMCEGLAVSSVPVQMACLDAFTALYLSSQFSDEDFSALICPMYTSENVNLLRRLFEWTRVDPRDIDDEKYTLSKKLSEMLSLLGNFIVQMTSAIPENCDLPKLLDLFLLIAQSQSLVVSIPILVTWTRLLRSETIGASPTVTPLVGPLLDLCSSRLVRYESLPEDAEDLSMLFLLEDIDTIPERHAFLGNYRRYSIQIIESIVLWKHSEAIYYILNFTMQSMEVLQGAQSLSIETYSKTSMPVLQVDAQFTVVGAALKGYMKWRPAIRWKLHEVEQERNRIENDFEAWCGRLLEMKFDDPIIRKRILQLSVAFSTSALQKKSGFMLKVLEQLLTHTVVEDTRYRAYADAVKELQNESLHELSRLAIKMPDQLLDVFDQLQTKVNEILASGIVDSKQQVTYQTFLFSIVHRATAIDPGLRMQRLEAFIAPVKQLWQNAGLDEAISTFEGFFALLGLEKARDYMISRRVNEVQDWSTLHLDSEGQAIQAELNDRVKALPLRPTKSFLACSNEKIENGSELWKISCSLWHDSVPLILPDVLKFLSYSHAFYNIVNWSGLPAEMHGLANRILTDRFWQSGISEGSKDDFYARVTGTRTTMEGLASTIRGSVRTVRDACYALLFGLSRLDVHFYGFKELPGPLAHALFANAHCLSSHQFINLLNLVRYLADDCPPELRDHFVPPLMATCFTQLDAKISSEWETLGQKQQATSEDENLTEEMKEESILRQLTHNAVMMVAGFLDPERQNPPLTMTAKEASTYNPERRNNDAQQPIMRDFCLSSIAILEPLILFCTHAIRFRDTRCCGVVLRILRSIVPEFRASNANVVPIREFISSEVLKACISSIHEPYFVDLQKDIAQLIATILKSYCPLTDTPKQVLLSLPRIDESSVSKCIDYLHLDGVGHRQQRALVLDLLQDLKGVSVSEQGRITKTARTIRKERSRMQQEFLKVDIPDNVKKEASPNLDGVAGMFEG